MASTNKRPALSANIDTTNAEQIVEADFEGRNLEVQDFHGVKKLLQQIFLKEHVDVSLFTDMLIAQAGIGSVLKQSSDDNMDDDDDDVDDDYVFGITSVLNLTAHQETAAVKQLFELVQRLAKQNKSEERLETILNETNKIGLLINERFVNLPAVMADPLLTSLQTELKRMKKRDPSYNFDYYVLICKTCKPKKGKDQCFFVNEEEQIFNDEAEFYLEYNVASQCDTAYEGKWEETDVEVIPHRRVLFIQANKLDCIISKVKEFVCNSALDSPCKL